MNESQQLVVKIITDHHAQISAFAKKAYGLDGRGCLHIVIPKVAPGESFDGVRDMKYTAEAALRSLLANGASEDASKLLDMVRTYDPARQAVVMAAIDGELPISMKMKLDLATLVEGPEEPQ